MDTLFHGVAWHELVYGTILANIAIGLSTLRFMFKIYRKYGRKIKFFFEKIDILWFDYGARLYPNKSALEITNLLNKELENYVGRE